MIIKHNFTDFSVKKRVKEKKPSLLLTNNKGGFLLLSQEAESRYYGWFIRDKDRNFKILEEIRTGKEINYWENNHFWIRRKKDQWGESFWLVKEKNSLVYSTEQKSEIELILDVKKIFDNREWGRNYEFYEENIGKRKKLVIKFEKKTDKREDETGGEKEYQIFIVIDKIGNYEQVNKWEGKYYIRDEIRNSPPFYRYVYRALKIKEKKPLKLIITAGTKKEKALKENEEIRKNPGKYWTKEEKEYKETEKKLRRKRNLPKKEPELLAAYLCAGFSLKKLIIKEDAGKKEKLMAGLPWFFQEWSRDTAICLGAVKRIDEEAYKKISEKLLKKIEKGVMKNKLDDETSLDSIDAPGWLFFNLEKDKIKGKERALKKYMKEIEAERMKNELVWNKALETWHDTGEEWNNSREGCRIEIQALVLKALNLAGEKKKETELRQRVREKFYQNKKLLDGVSNSIKDKVIRPNIFLAAKVYPELLNKDEWRGAIKKILPRLWLKWGGLTSLEKRSPMFCEEYSGENNQSYHRGDSWFWINNISAEVMYRIDKIDFRSKILGIIRASAYDILWQGTVGGGSELSSAKELRAEGCPVQAWSNATYIELFDGIKLE